MYFDDNISNTNIGLDVQINGKACAHIWMWHGGSLEQKKESTTVILSISIF